MPSSYIENIPPIMRFIERMRPQRVLDVGVGYGKYGYLIRERVDNFQWGILLHGVEGFAGYIDKAPVLKFYNRIYNWDYMSMKRSMFPKEGYDLVLMIDVLEHFEEAAGRAALKHSIDLGQKVLISTPIGYEQGPVNGNDLERHLSEWPHDKLMDFADRHELGYEIIQAGTTDSVIAVLSR